MMSINAVKGVEVGRGFPNTRKPGREAQDAIVPDPTDRRRFRRLTNAAGGIEGGMTNGEPVVVYVAVKPIATMTRPLPSVDINTGEAVEAAYHRSDICQVPRATPIGEAMMGLVLARAFLEKFGGDSLDETRRNYVAYVASHQQFGTGVTAGTSHPAPAT
jgi:chorismate synthase